MLELGKGYIYELVFKIHRVSTEQKSPMLRSFDAPFTVALEPIIAPSKIALLTLESFSIKQLRRFESSILVLAPIVT